MRKLLIILLLINTALGIEYYADVNILINNDGNVISTGETNYPGLIRETQELTSKNKEYWLFNLTINELFTDYIIKVKLPQASEINYLTSPSSVKISNELNNIIITSVGSNESINLVIQYKINSVSNNYNIYYLMLFFIGISLIIYYLINKKKIKKIDYSFLTERQAEIIKIIKSKNRITQKELENTLRIPKSALSRNIDALVRKELIMKQKKGMSNIIIPVNSRNVPLNSRKD